MSFLQKETGMTLLVSTPPGTCPECAVEHGPAEPHNKDSLFYQYKFYDKHGRWPTWADAMVHCAEEIKVVWKKELEMRGIKLEIGDTNG
jgi:hypothetical protein